MTIASEIYRIQNNISNAYSAVFAMGGTIPAFPNSDNLASAINTIPSGSTPFIPTGTINITENGTYNVYDYESAYINAVNPDDRIAEILAKTVTSYTTSGVSEIRLKTFEDCHDLILASFTSCKRIYGEAFKNCTNLITAYFPDCSMIYSSVFYNCTSLSSIYFPVCKIISSKVFYNCTTLTSISFPKCTTISWYSFENCINLESVSLPVCTDIGRSAFKSCSKLTSINLPSCTAIADLAFEDCINLTTIKLGTSSCTIYDSNTFKGTGIGSNTGFIYVPRNYVYSYQRDSIWKFFSSRIFAG